MGALIGIEIVKGNHVSSLLTRLGQSHQVSANLLKLGGWQRYCSGILGVWNAQVLLINVHQLDVVFTDPIVQCAFKHEVDDVWRVLGFERQDIFVLRTAEHFGQRCEIDAQGDVAVAAERGEGFGLEHHRHQGHVGIVHGLESDARVIAIEVAILDQVLDRLDHLWRSCQRASAVAENILAVPS